MCGAQKTRKRDREKERYKCIGKRNAERRERHIGSENVKYFATKFKSYQVKYFGTEGVAFIVKLYLFTVAHKRAFVLLFNKYPFLFVLRFCFF